jgi:hypothetical protein
VVAPVLSAIEIMDRIRRARYLQRGAYAARAEAPVGAPAQAGD